MSATFKLARTHWGGILAAFLCALFIALPLIVFPSYLGNAYKGININHYGTDEDFYLARANDVASRHTLGQPFLSTGKEHTDPTFYKVEQVVMFPYIFFDLESHITVVDWYNTLNTFGVFILVLLLYALAFSIGKNKLLAVAIAVFVLGGHSIIFYKTLFYTEFNVYGRSIFPYAASIPFFTYVLLLYQSTVKKRGLLSVVGAGVFFGLLFYDYFYAWTFAAALLGSLFLISLVTKNWVVVKRVVVVGSIAGVIALPFLVSFYQFFSSGDGATIAYFLRAEYTHNFIMSILGMGTLLLFCIYIWRKRHDTNNAFILACILAGWVALEQQMLTGRAIEYGHYYWYFIVPLSIIVSLYMIFSVIPQRLRMWFAVFVIVIALINTVGGQYQSFFTTLPEKTHDQLYAEALERLNELPYGVVLGGHGIESFPILVTILTKDDLFFNPSALVYHTEEKQLREILLTYLALNKETDGDPTAYITKSLNEGVISPYTRLYQDIEGYTSGLSYEEYMKKIEEGDLGLLKHRTELLATLQIENKELASSKKLRSLLMERGVAYVLWDKTLYPEWDLSSLEPLKEISENDAVILYQLVEGL